jgi:hypothetical protein
MPTKEICLSDTQHAYTEERKRRRRSRVETLILPQFFCIQEQWRKKELHQLS